jgi:hypothetical protein
MDARDSAGATAFDFEALAELFPPRSRNANRQSAGYRENDKDVIRSVESPVAGHDVEIGNSSSRSATSSRLTP